MTVRFFSILRFNCYGKQCFQEHQKAFADIKNYYNDITHNNLDLIKSKKEEVKDGEIEERKDQVSYHYLYILIVFLIVSSNL
jgi:hypothetical protein